MSSRLIQFSVFVFFFYTCIACVFAKDKFESKVVAVIDNIPFTNIEVDIIFDAVREYNDLALIKIDATELKEQKLELLNSMINVFLVTTEFKRLGASLSREQITAIENSFVDITNKAFQKFLREDMASSFMLTMLMDREYKNRLSASQNEIYNMRYLNNPSIDKESIMLAKYSFPVSSCSKFSEIKFDILKNKKLNNVRSKSDPVWIEKDFLPDNVIEKMSHLSDVEDIFYTQNKKSCDVYRIYDRENSEILDSYVLGIPLQKDGHSGIGRAMCNARQEQEVVDFEMNYESKNSVENVNADKNLYKLSFVNLKPSARKKIIQSNQYDIVDLENKEKTKFLICDDSHLNDVFENIIVNQKIFKYSTDIIEQIRQRHLIEIRRDNIT
ncbi:hypothetical protein GUI12_01600 [Anaplasmataceae bacterium AB001_6]|nr:hypothetical protein GUI12_01600 [Anaplasmataceae bacterium AB001_6]